MNFSNKHLLKPSGDQPEAIKKLVKGIKSRKQFQTLLGVTGSGKTLTMAHVISKLNRPALIMSHNKTLAAQLYQEFKEFFPDNSVHYFVSYYDYYQPEAYLPTTDIYIEKDAKINEFIDRLRHATTQGALTRRDFIVVASVSCIYGIGDPEEYAKMSMHLKLGLKIKRQKFLERLTDMQYERNDYERLPGMFSVKGEAIEIVSPDGETIIGLEFFGDEIERISERKNSLDSKFLTLDSKEVFPAKHFVTPKDKLNTALVNIEKELDERLLEFKKEGKLLEAERLEQRTHFDLEMFRTTGYVSGVENYSRHLSFREPGSPPSTLLDYLPKDTITFIDESHMSIPQVRGMYFGDQSRKQTLIDYGFRLPSALDNRPLKFEEFEKKIGQTIFVSATPNEWELEKSAGNIAEQLVRPTGLLDPLIEVRPINSPGGGQIKDAIREIEKTIKAKERVLLVTLTKRLSEEISEYLKEKNIKAEYLHSEIKTIERTDILKKLREGEFDVLVGINLLREGLDLPEVALVIILDADKEGYLRNYTSLVQTIGRAARHVKGRAILYGDAITKSMQKTIEETLRRRKYQEDFNKKRGIKPMPIVKKIRKGIFDEISKASALKNFGLPEKLADLSKRDRLEAKNELEKMMLEAATNLEFEKAARLRDILKTLA
ncbi:excinuclease ABC subunit B [Candidatus Giovannonibacteria bacterium RIFCSPHIGHO2_02_42_15]|uniref:UvrABC system protein B n=2 Tax=Candidatus Giovannoniibacteriota TaxID=1752738 RepID=A0A1F5VM69_9BACT|nr:MAG: UvrABC system protein B [Candidatus Giovannonibacteria bacterium GW2011_GWF2_42_19]OGF64121.1 MAG: excinuclease ABC subunit B [Candidatus Giovannonibacteria bacterium RIFCSPHIGHO2_02_42_15]